MKLNHLLLTFLFSLCLNISLGQSMDLITSGKFKKAEVPFDYVNGFIVLNVKFMDIFELKFLFDTGAEHTIITKRDVTDILQFNYEKRFTLVGADLSTELYAYLVRGVKMEFKGIKAINRSVLVLEEDYFRFEEFSGINVQGILGADFFSRFIIKINYPRKTITFYNPQYFSPPEEEDNLIELPIELYRNKPYLFANVTFNTSSKLPVKLLLDTGAGLPLLLHTNTHPQLQLPPHTITSNIGMGMGGFLEGFIGRVDLLHIGKYNVPGVITSYQELSSALDTSYLNKRNGILGNQILNRFEVTIDYLHEKLYLIPNKALKDKFNFDKSGLILASSGIGLNKFTVFGVIPSSPAQEAGILPGDQIKTLNGIPVAFFTMESLTNKMRKKSGKKIRLKMRRNGIKIKRHFVLRELI